MLNTLQYFFMCMCMSTLGFPIFRVCLLSVHTGPWPHPGLFDTEATGKPAEEAC